jgi:hypothetical protein
MGTSKRHAMRSKHVLPGARRSSCRPWPRTLARLPQKSAARGKGQRPEVDEPEEVVGSRDEYRDLPRIVRLGRQSSSPGFDRAPRRGVLDLFQGSPKLGTCTLQAFDGEMAAGEGGLVLGSLGRLVGGLTLPSAPLALDGRSAAAKRPQASALALVIEQGLGCLPDSTANDRVGHSSRLPPGEQLRVERRERYSVAPKGEEVGLYVLEIPRVVGQQAHRAPGERPTVYDTCPSLLPTLTSTQICGGISPTQLASRSPSQSLDWLDRSPSPETVLARRVPRGGGRGGFQTSR